MSDLSPEGKVWYRTNRWDTKIETVIVYKATNSFITVNDSWAVGKKRRVSRAYHYPTWQEAWDSLLKRYEREVARAQDELHRAKTSLGMVKSMEAP